MEVTNPLGWFWTQYSFISRESETRRILENSCFLGEWFWEHQQRKERILNVFSSVLRIYFPPPQNLEVVFERHRKVLNLFKLYFYGMYVHLNWYYFVTFGFHIKYLIYIMEAWGRYYYIHIVDEETMNQRSNLLKVTQKVNTRLGFKFRSDSKKLWSQNAR